MVFNDIGGSLNQLTQKLSMIDPQELQQMLTVPDFDSFASQFSGILPQNLVNTGAGGVQNMLNPTNISNQLNQVAGQLLPQVTQQLQNQLNSIAGGLPAQVMSVAQNLDFTQLGSQLKEITQQFSSVSSEQMINLLQQNFQTGQFSNLMQAAQGGLPGASFSPKAIRDLADPQKLAAQAQQFSSIANNKITEVAEQMAQARANNPVYSNSGQNNLQQLSSPNFSGNNKNGYKLAARLTAYWAKGPGTDVDSAALKSSTGRQLAEGISCAVDPSVIPYGSTVDIPGVGTRLAVDTGGAVKGKTASGGRLPIIDVFFNTAQSAYAANVDRDTVVTVYPPASKWVYVKNASPTYGAA